MGCLSEFGKLGLTSIGDSPQQAKEIYHRVVVLDEEPPAILLGPHSTAHRLERIL